MKTDAWVSEEVKGMHVWIVEVKSGGKWWPVRKLHLTRKLALDAMYCLRKEITGYVQLRVKKYVREAL